MELTGLSLRRFTVAELHRMREAGILAPQARIELLAGALVDVPRPSAREMEVTHRLAAMLAEHFEGATVEAREAIHPEAYALFDPTLMIHEWERFPLTAPYRLHRFSIEEYRRLMSQAVLWVAKLPIPEKGLAVELPESAYVLEKK